MAIRLPIDTDHDRRHPTHHQLPTNWVFVLDDQRIRRPARGPTPPSPTLAQDQGKRMDEPVNPVEVFIARWQGAGGRERANYQLFLTELATLLDLPTPHQATAEDRANAFVFERRVSFRHADGSESERYIDLYPHGCLVLEPYTPVPDPRTHRIRLSHLRNADTRQRLRTILDTLVAIGRARSDGSGRYTSA